MPHNVWAPALGVFIGDYRARWALGLSVLLLTVIGGLWALDRLLPPPLDQVRLSDVVRDRHGEVLRAFPVEEGRWRLPAHLDDIDPDFIEALLAYEDQRFYRHHGVDGVAVLRASLDSAKAGRIVSGASTLTMQTARLLEPRPRHLGSKLIEMLRAVQLEHRLTKDEILELYLTLAPYGGNLEGVRAASWAYFGQEPNDLPLEDIALLIALPQSPEARRPDLRPANAQLARSRVLERLASAGLASPSAALDARDDPAPTRRVFPAKAWHGAEFVRGYQLDQHQRGQDRVSTLDARLQASVESVIANALPRGDQDVQIAVMVVETRTRAVRALIGSAGRDRPGGWIDLTHRQRSPGSTLKPFIYGLAFDDGLAAGNTRIADLPRRFAGYRPDNFDRRFRGDVTIAEALQHSLNVPAVSVLEGVGAHRFNTVLSFAGAGAQRLTGAGEDSGLAVALGGAGMTARDLSVLYAALGEGGEAKPLRWLEHEAGPEHGYAVLSGESAGEILDILRAAPHPAGRMPAHLAQNAPDIAFKTGTSYGYRDAWAAGVAGGYSVVVWAGRADGAPRPGITGREGALPILFEVFDAVARFDPTGFSRAQSASPEQDWTPRSLQRFQADPAPHILFPPDGAEVWLDRADRSYVLSAQAQGRVRWYVDGAPIAGNGLGDAIWQPVGPGFYTLEVVDEAGRSARSRIRLKGRGGS
ncbi:penicillin-binding protein 1C [Woodsholea maritima]|uniref:penicillin-binding protein 1C n=1 Tax=Woodsholea maritima TaxID=240237 RepID=UPI00036CEC84|nr:penicillin-binding protein 1C [Woodsholea maritima]